jgi:membrane-associated phospholipid phosphatase
MMKHLLIILLCAMSLNCAAQDKTYHGDGPDDYLRFVPIASVFALKACGVESASSWKRLAVNTAASYVISSGVTYSLKHFIHERRPDGTDNKSFPSGHSAAAFAGATILYKEYRHVSPWIGVAGYGVAAFTAIDRVCRNRHNWGDVAAGAAIGVVGTEAGYWLGDLITGEKSKYNVAVCADGVALTINL